MTERTFVFGLSDDPFVNCISYARHFILKIAQEDENVTRRY